MSTEEGYFPQGVASRSWTIRNAEAPRSALEAKCSSPVEVLALRGGRLFGTRELGAGARQYEKRRTLTFCSVLREHVYVLFNQSVLRLRLPADSRKLDSSAQGSREVDSRQ